MMFDFFNKNKKEYIEIDKMGWAEQFIEDLKKDDRYIEIKLVQKSGGNPEVLISTGSFSGLDLVKAMVGLETTKIRLFQEFKGLEEAYKQYLKDNDMETTLINLKDEKKGDK